MKFKTNAIRFLFISILGVLLHFTYEWSDDNRIVGLFSAVNESTWEHMKLLAVPWVLWTIAECIGLRSLRPAGIAFILSLPAFAPVRAPPSAPPAGPPARTAWRSCCCRTWR